MDEIFRTKFGSHLYGTATPQSDEDWKAVFIPERRNILLGRGSETVQINSKTDKRTGFQRKNEPGEIDTEAHSLKKFLGLAADGQTVALDMLFATPLVHERRLEGSSCFLWEEIWSNRRRLASRRFKAFLGYAYKQASKYGVKGSRMAAAEKVARFFDAQINRRGTTAKVGEGIAEWVDQITGTEHTSDGLIDQPGDRKVGYFECCGRKVLHTATIKEAAEIFNRIFDEYGHRARQARDNENVDWKALSHAVRVGRQAIEYLSVGHMTFPRPEAARLLDIKTGALPYLEVAEEIEELLEQVQAAADHSPLPENPDQEWIDDFIVNAYEFAL